MQSTAAIPRTKPLAVRIPVVDRAILILGCVGLFSILLFAATIARYGHTAFTTDAHLYYVHAHSWYFDHDIHYANNIAADPTFGARDMYLAQRGLGERTINIFPCGWSMATLPFLALADVATVLHNAWSITPLPRDGFSGFYKVIVPLGHFFLGLIGLGASFSLASRYFPRDTAAVATAVVWLGTNVCYFVAIEPTMSHAASLCFVSLTLLITDTIHRSGWTFRRAAALGGSVGLMSAVRHQDVVWAVVPLMLLGPQCLAGMGRPRPLNIRNVSMSLSCATMAILFSALFLIPQIVINLAMYGTPMGGAAQFSPDWLHPKFFRDLFMLPGGLFVLFPLTLAAAVGWMPWLRQSGCTWPAAALGIGFLCCLYINACGIEGTARRYVCAAPIFIMGLCAVWPLVSQRRWSKRLAVCGTVALVAKNALLMLMVDRGWVDRFLFTSVIQDSTPLLSAIFGS